MKIGTSSVHNTSLSMKQLDPRHINNNLSKKNTQNIEQSFADVFFKAINQVNSEQMQADNLQQASVVSPDSVNVADILIATEKARLSVGMLKAVTERASRAYTEIMNIR